MKYVHREEIPRSFWKLLERLYKLFLTLLRRPTSADFFQEDRSIGELATEYECIKCMRYVHEIVHNLVWWKMKQESHETVWQELVVSKEDLGMGLRHPLCYP